MPDYTDPWLLPFPTEHEFGEGALQVDLMAHRVDEILQEADDRVTALTVRPTFIRRRSADVAWSVGNDLNFDTTDHNSAGVTGSGFSYSTPQVGAHAVAGVYPAIWRMDVNLFFIAGVPAVGDTRLLEVEVRQYNPATGAEIAIRTLEDNSIEANNGTGGGHYSHISACLMLDRPTTFEIDYFSPVNGTIKANSFFALTRIRSV